MAWLGRVTIQIVMLLGGGLVGRDIVHGLAAGLYRATLHREHHDTALEVRDTAPCVTIQCAIWWAAARAATQGHDTAAYACDTASHKP